MPPRKTPPRQGLDLHLSEPLSTGKGWLDTYYLWMVPTYEITMNPELTQNPGYEALFGSAGNE